MKNESGRMYAWIRALIFGIQVGYIEAEASGNHGKPLLYVDEVDRISRDFHISVDTTFGTCMNMPFPSRAFEGVVVRAVSAASTAFGVFKRMTALEGMEFKTEEAVESVYPYIMDKSTIPLYMQDEGMNTSEGSTSTLDFGLSPTAKNWKNRIVSGGPSVQAREVFNTSGMLDIFIDDEEASETLQHAAHIQKSPSQPPTYPTRLKSIAGDCDEED